MIPRAARPYVPHLGFAVYIGALLALDSRAGLRGQLALGAATFALLFVSVRRLAPDERFAVWMCVGFSTLIELCCTQLWGLYHYRLGNVPLYVPAGHGLIYVFALTAARTPLLTRSPRHAVAAALAVAIVWSGWGLCGAHPDVHGALYLPFFFAYLLRSPRAPLFVATFAITAYIELVGVHLGTWHWAAVMPGLGVPSGDPPSLIAGGYCFFGEVALALTSLRPGNRKAAIERAAAIHLVRD